jgi:hypothetical protein
MSDRNSLIEKIRALMAKTTSNGCTEFEMSAALDKARALMDAYEVSADELKLAKEEAAILRGEPDGTKDPHHIKGWLATSVAHFTDCKVWRKANKGGGLVFCGLRTDTQFATWLLDTLTAFVQAELANHLIGNTFPRTSSERKAMIVGFVSGCTGRINRRLDALVEQSKVNMVSSGRELVVTKKHAIDETMRKAGIHLGKSRSTRTSYNPDSYQAGKAAGDRASFGRPVSGQNATLRLGAN